MSRKSGFNDGFPHELPGVQGQRPHHLQALLRGQVENGVSRFRVTRPDDADGDAARVHGGILPPAATAWSAANNRALVTGTSRITTPRSATASSTAFAIAAAPGMAPLSPTPLTPSGLIADGCSSRATGSGGSPAGLRMAESLRLAVRSWPCASYTTPSTRAAPIDCAGPPPSSPPAYGGLSARPRG